MTIKAMGAKSRMGRTRPLVLAALAMAVAGCSGNHNNSSASSALPASTFSAVSAIQGSQSIIALDPVNQAIWVPSYTLDANGNLQYELISTAAAVAGGTAAISKKVSMVDCDTPIGIAFAGSGASSGTLLVECGNSTTLNLYLNAVDAGSLTVTPIATPGLSWNGNGGGIIYDPQNNQAFVAGSQNVGLLQVPAGAAPSLEANSVTTMPFDPNIGLPDTVGAMAMDFNTQQVVISVFIPIQPPYSFPPPNVAPYVVDTSVISTSAPALNITQLPYLTDSNGNAIPVLGAAFDSVTDVLALAGDIGGGGDRGYSAFYQPDDVGVLNMDSYTASGPSVDSELVYGFLDYYVPDYNEGSDSTLGGTGGLAALNPATHQVLVGDAWGPNLLLVQLPSAILGPNVNLDNNGQPSTQGVASLTAPDATSTYAIAQTLVSVQTAEQSTQLNTKTTQLNALGAPPALVIDQVNNIAYVLADNSTVPHAWTTNTGVTLVLASVDLSAPVPSACPSLYNVICPTNWNPLAAQVVVP